MVDRDACRSQAGQEYGSYRCGIESDILGVWRKGLAALQSDRQVQLVAKVFDDAINLFLSHVSEPSAYPELTDRFWGLF